MEGVGGGVWPAPGAKQGLSLSHSLQRGKRRALAPLWRSLLCTGSRCAVLRRAASSGGAPQRARSCGGAPRRPPRSVPSPRIPPPRRRRRRSPRAVGVDQVRAIAATRPNVGARARGAPTAGAIEPRCAFRFARTTHAAPCRGRPPARSPPALSTTRRRAPGTAAAIASGRPPRDRRGPKQRRARVTTAGGPGHRA